MGFVNLISGREWRLICQSCCSGLGQRQAAEDAETDREEPLRLGGLVDTAAGGPGEAYLGGEAVVRAPRLDISQRSPLLEDLHRT